MSIPVAKLDDAVADVLNKYEYNVNEAFKDELQKIAEETVNEAKVNAKAKYPKSKKYWKSWKVKKVSDSAMGVRLVIHSTQYRIAHLLENGHILITHGKAVGRVEGRPHIKPAEENMERKIDQKVKVRIESI